MKKSIMLCISLLITILFIARCSNNDNVKDIEDIGFEEAKKIATEQGYVLNAEDSTSYNDILVGDSGVFEFILDASIQYGYLEEDFNSMTGDRKIFGYELEEKSKEDKPIMLCLVIDKSKVIGAYLDYAGYKPGIEPINFKDNFK